MQKVERELLSPGDLKKVVVGGIHLASGRISAFEEMVILVGEVPKT